MGRGCLCRCFFGQSIGEIANAYHCSENVVFVTLFRVRGKLKNRLEREGWEL